MGIKQKTPLSEITAYTVSELRKLHYKIITTLMYVGEQCVNEARRNGSYLDQTGNLRSSIGYVVLHNGVAVSPINFEQVKKGSKGTSKGEQFIKQLAAQYSKGYTLIVVAGMNYAAHVEARGLNVLASSELKAENITPKMLKKLGLK